MKPVDINWDLHRSSSDPYVIMNVGATQCRSRTIYKTLNPSWETEHDFLVTFPEQQDLLIEVYDENTLSHGELLGRTSVPLSNLFYQDGGQEWFSLSDSDGSCERLAPQI